MTQTCVRVDDVVGAGVCGGDDTSSKPLPLFFAIFACEVVGLFFTLFFRNSSSLKNLQVGIFMLPEPDLFLSLIFFQAAVKTIHLVFPSSFQRKKLFEKMTFKLETSFPFF